MAVTSLVRLILGNKRSHTEGFAILAASMVVITLGFDLSYALQELMPVQEAVLALSVAMLIPVFLAGWAASSVVVLLLTWGALIVFYRWGIRSAQTVISTMHWFVFAAIVWALLGESNDAARVAILLDLFVTLLLTGIVIAYDAQFDMCKADRRRSLWRAGLFGVVWLLMCYQLGSHLFMLVLALFALLLVIFLALYLWWWRDVYTSRRAALLALLD